MLIAYKEIGEIKELKLMLSLEFQMKDLGLVKKILGVEINMNRSKGLIFLT